MEGKRAPGRLVTLSGWLLLTGVATSRACCVLLVYFTGIRVLRRPLHSDLATVLSPV